MADGEFCNASQRVDGKLHSWEFDGDDPRVKCCWCGEMRDALTGDPIKASPVSTEPDPWEFLRELLQSIRDADNLLMPAHVVKATHLFDEATAALKQRDAERNGK